MQEAINIHHLSSSQEADYKDYDNGPLLPLMMMRDDSLMD